MGFMGPTKCGRCEKCFELLLLQISEASFPRKTDVVHFRRIGPQPRERRVGNLPRTLRALPFESTCSPPFAHPNRPHMPRGRTTPGCRGDASGERPAGPVAAAHSPSPVGLVAAACRLPPQLVVTRGRASRDGQGREQRAAD
jgi:hypothetical protein